MPSRYPPLRPSTPWLARTLIFVTVAAIITTVVALVLVLSPTDAANRKSHIPSDLELIGDGSHFLIVPGSRPGTVRFDFHVNSRKVLESRDMATTNCNLESVMTQIASTMETSGAPGRIQFSGVSGAPGFVVRNTAGHVIAFSVVDYRNAPSGQLRSDMDLVVSRSKSATISVTKAYTFDNANDNFEKIILIIFSEDGKFCFKVQHGGEVVHQQNCVTSKSQLVRTIGEYFRHDSNPSSATIVDQTEVDDDKKDQPHMREAWDKYNNPDIFHLGGKPGFEYNYATIRSNGWNSGRSRVMAWPDTYWPTFEDGLGHRWQSTSGDHDNTCSSDIDCLSPLEKYDMAFNNWRPQKKFFEYRPFDPNQCGWTDRPVAKHWDDQLYLMRGPAASRIQGNAICHNGIDDSQNGMVDDCTKNGCEYLSHSGQAMLPRWFGLCHQWVPASILQPEPQHAVVIKTADGIAVPFQVSDIKGLSMTLGYNTIFFGTRCDLEDKNIPRDRFGRIDNQACRNTNAGAFHVILANMIGRDGRPFAMDRTWDAPVWNQPIVGYKLISETDIDSAADACRWLGGCSGSGYNWNLNAKSWVAISVSVSWVSESYPSRSPRMSMAERFISSSKYNYLLELDARGNIVGGEWKFGEPEHPDFLFLPFERESRVEDDFQNVDPAKVQDLINQASSSDTRSIEPGPSSTRKSSSDDSSKSIMLSDVSCRAELSVTAEEPPFIVSSTEVQIFMAGCSLDEFDLTLILSHGLVSFEKRYHVTNCAPAEISTYAFSNMLSTGSWDLEILQSSGAVEIVGWTMQFTVKMGALSPSEHSLTLNI